MFHAASRIMIMSRQQMAKTGHWIAQNCTAWFPGENICLDNCIARKGASSKVFKDHAIRP